MKNVIERAVILGDALVTGALEYALLESTSCKVFIITHSELKNVERVKLHSNRGILADILMTSKHEYEDMDMLESRMENSSCRCAYVKSDDESFSDLILNSSLIISCCRSGLYEYYVGKLNKLATKGKKIPIISIDNDNSIYIKANSMNTNPNIAYYKGIIHSVVSKRVIESNSTIVYYGSGFVNLFLPQEAWKSDMQLRYMPISRAYARIKICNRDELSYIITVKRVKINMLHSIISGIAICKLISEGTDFKEALSIPINSVLDYNQVYPTLKMIDSISTQYYLSRYPLYKDENSNALASDAFIKYIFNDNNEVIARAMSLNNISNLKKHIDDLSFCMEALENSDARLYKYIKNIRTMIESIAKTESYLD